MDNIGALVKSIPIPRGSVPILLTGAYIFLAAACAGGQQTQSTHVQAPSQIRANLPRDYAAEKRNLDTYERFERDSPNWSPGSGEAAGCRSAYVSSKTDRRIRRQALGVVYTPEEQNYLVQVCRASP